MKKLLLFLVVNGIFLSAYAEYYNYHGYYVCSGSAQTGYLLSNKQNCCEGNCASGKALQSNARLYLEAPKITNIAKFTYGVNGKVITSDKVFPSTVFLLNIDFFCYNSALFGGKKETFWYKDGETTINGNDYATIKCRQQ